MKTRQPVLPYWGARGRVKLLTDHPYITSGKGLGEWVQKVAVFEDVQYYIYADKVGGSEKVQNYADLIYGWSLTLL